MPFNRIGRFVSSGGTVRKNEFKRPVTFFDRVRFVGSDSTMEIFGGVLSGDISADLLTTGILDVDRINAGTLTVSKLVIGSFDNLISDPGFESGDSPVNSIHTFIEGGGDWTISNSAFHSGDFSARYDPASQTGDAKILFGTNRVACQVDDVFALSVWHDTGAGSTYNDTFLQSLWYDSDNVFLSASTTVETPGDVWSEMTASHTAPVGAANGRFQVGIQNDGGDKIHFLDDVYVRRKIGTLIIEGQAVDIERMLNPVFSATAYATVGNKTITTFDAVLVTENFTVPSWVGTLSVMAIGMVTKGGGGATQDYIISAEIASTSSIPAFFHYVSEDFTGLTAFTRTISTPGATVFVRTTGIALTSNQGGWSTYINAIATGVR